MVSDIANPNIMLKYHHSPLSRPDNIRLLRLLPREQNSEHLQGELFEYNPRKKVKGTCLYEALSYVWGNEDNSQSIIIDNRCLDITPNLQLALLHLRDDDIPRIIWVDAVCINQTDTKEKESQIPLISEIYARASCVLVWLGPANGDGDQALDAICRAGERSDELSSLESKIPGAATVERRFKEYLEKSIEGLSDSEKIELVVKRLGELVSGKSDISELLTTKEPEKSAVLLEVEPFKESVLRLLERPWFRRIWVLQEVAVAQNVLIMCGFTEMNGHAFCVGLEALSSAFKSKQFMNPVTFLIRGSIFRPPYASRNRGKNSLGICSLGELFDMYHSHETTVLHDKVYALVGMCSDDLKDAGLEPHYEITWSTLMKRLLHFLLSNTASVDACEDKQVAVIRTKGSILGEVSSVNRNIDLSQKQTLVINMRSRPRSRSRTRESSEYESDRIIRRRRSPFRARRRSRSLTRESSGYDSDRIIRRLKSPFRVRRRSRSRTRESSGYESDGSTHWTLHTTAKPIRDGDILCFLQGASKPSIIRLHDDNDHFTIIAIAVTPPKHVKIKEKEVEWSRISQSMTFSRDFLLVWDWDNISGNLQDGGKYESLIQARYLHSEDGLKKRLDKATRAWNVALVLEDLGAYGMAQARFEEAVEGYESALGKEPSMALQIRQSSIVQVGTDPRRIQPNSQGPRGLTPLLWSALNGHEAIVELLLAEDNIDSDCKDYHGNTALLYAAKNGHCEVVKLLLATGKVDVNAKDRNGETPLLLAAKNDHIGIVELLLATGEANVNVYARNYDSKTSRARRRSGYIVEETAPAARGVEGKALDEPRAMTSLGYAAYYGNEAMVEMLLATGKADVDFSGPSTAQKDHDSPVRGQTPLSVASEKGHHSIVKLLLGTGRANVNSECMNRTPLSYAAGNGHESVVKLLLETENIDVDRKDRKTGRTALSYAAEKGNLIIVEDLLAIGRANVDSRDREGRKPLRWAIANGREEVAKLLRDKMYQ